MSEREIRSDFISLRRVLLKSFRKLEKLSEGPLGPGHWSLVSHWRHIGPATVSASEADTAEML